MREGWNSGPPGKAFRCPQCGGADDIVAIVTVGVQTHPDGELEGDPDVLVDKIDECVCNECDFEGKVANFVSDEGNIANSGGDDVT